MKISPFPNGDLSSEFKLVDLFSKSKKCDLGLEFQVELVDYAISD